MTYGEDPLLKIAISLISGMTAAAVEELHDKGISLNDFFTWPASRLSEAASMRIAAAELEESRNNAIAKARDELAFASRHSITPLYAGDPEYPFRLKAANDAPAVIYRLGDTDLNQKHILSIVGTRKPTTYGTTFCNKTVSHLASTLSGLVIVSGLAYGIDSAAHKASLEAGAPTVGVLAHGLAMIYPAAHRGLAKQMLDHGGALVTEYLHDTKPLKPRFLQRNRIVATLCDAVLVAESGIRGGAMSTANTAFHNGRDVFALPGRSSDTMSEGCNHLIKRNKAALVTEPTDIAEAMNWQPEAGKAMPSRQETLPGLPTPVQAAVYDCIASSDSDTVSIDEIHASTSLSVAAVMATLSELEFDGLIIRHPGNRYSLT